MRIPITIVFLALAAPAFGADEVAHPLPFSSERWTIQAGEHRLEEHLGRPSLFLKGGIAWIEDVEFLDGMIEFDIAFSGERGFVGGLWRAQDRRNFEEFYLRPHQSGNPDATQYTPIFHGSAGWQLYHGDGYGAPVTYVFDQWMPVRIVFSGDRGEVFIRDMDKPAVVIHELLREPRAGRVGVMAGGYAPAHFSNFRYRELKQPALQTPPAQREAPPAGTITRWAVSDPLAESALEGMTTLPDEIRRGRSWTPLAADRSGITNLARVQGLSNEADTTFARVRLTAADARTARLDLGYSDRARVYLNGRLLYAGNRDYRSRDYRYLGTIGLFDSVYLPLEAGDHELWIAVSESFGGWGLLARIQPEDGLQVAAP